MICPNCGKEITEGSRFCGSCGAKIDENVLRDAQMEKGTDSSEREEIGPEMTTVADAEKTDNLKKKAPVKLIAAAAVAVVLIVVLILAFSGGGSKKKTININNYVSVIFSGYDTIGTASSEFDYDLFYADYEDLEWDEEALCDYVKAMYADYDISDEDIEEAVAELIEMYEPAEIIYEEFYYSLSLNQTSGLSNGDTVALTWSVDEEEVEEMLSCLNCEVEYSDIEVTVEGLQELETYDPFDDIEVSFSGIDTIGTASVEITGNGDIASSLKYSLDQTDNLSNGDTITVTITTDADIFAESDGIILSPLEQEYTVEGLQELVTYNPFNDIEISFNGTEPGGTASISVTGSGLAQSIKFEMSTDSGLSNGDTVTVSVSSAADAFVSSDGVILDPTEQEYTVEGLSRYITSAEEIPDEDLLGMQKEVLDGYAAYVASSWDSRFTVKGMDYIGTYFLSSKTGEGNILYLMYKVTIEYYVESGSDIADNLYTIYYSACYRDLTATTEGELQVDYLDFSTSSNYTNLFDNWYVYGYGSLDEAYKDLVTTRIDKYTCENLVVDEDINYEPTYISYGPTEDASEYDGHYYKVFEVTMYWEDAESFCESVGGHLATITSEEENAFITELLVGYSEDVFMIGLHLEYEVYGAWVTGEALGYTNWGEGEPDYGKQTIGVISNVHKSGSSYDIDIGEWDDETDNKHYFICEWDSESGGTTSNSEYKTMIFASSVVEFSVGDPWTEDETAQDPENALGAPDDAVITLGAKGELILGFDEEFTDVEGDDIVIYESADKGETGDAADIYVSTDGSDWYFVGEAGGGTVCIDIGEYISEEMYFQYIKIVDKETLISNSYPGADIHAVGVYVMK